MAAGTTAIAGIGATEFSKDSGRSELRLAAEAITAALADAGLTAADVDGLVTFTMDGNAEIAVARELGIRELRFFSQIGYGGGAACATVQHAAMAVATGTADVVVCYRALNERSGRRFGQVAAGLAGSPTTAGIDNGWHYPMGLATPAAMVAMIARRYMHEYGATSEDFGRVTVADRRHAANNPKAWFYQRPVTLAEHQESRWIAEPLRLLDCCQESDGAVAVIVTSLDRARDLPRRPAVIAAAAQGSGPGQYIMTSYYRDDLAALPEMGVVARQLWRQAGIGPADVRTAVLYDHFTPYVLIQLEELGFCARGEARGFIADGAIEVGGRLPLNTHGGQLGEAYIHGMNGIAEAVRQIRGTSVNQVPGDGPVLVTAGTGVPTSGLILSLPALRLWRVRAPLAYAARGMPSESGSVCAGWCQCSRTGGWWCRPVRRAGATAIAKHSATVTAAALLRIVQNAGQKSAVKFSTDLASFRGVTLPPSQSGLPASRVLWPMTRLTHTDFPERTRLTLQVPSVPRGGPAVGCGCCAAPAREFLRTSDAGRAAMPVPEGPPRV
jgi:acetyl-CoA acetyltransferase